MYDEDNLRHAIDLKRICVEWLFTRLREARRLIAPLYVEATFMPSRAFEETIMLARTS